MLGGVAAAKSQTHTLHTVLYRDALGSFSSFYSGHISQTPPPLLFLFSLLGPTSLYPPLSPPQLSPHLLPPPGCSNTTCFLRQPPPPPPPPPRDRCPTLGLLCFSLLPLSGRPLDYFTEDTSCFVAPLPHCSALYRSALKDLLSLTHTHTSFLSAGCESASAGRRG